MQLESLLELVMLFRSLSERLCGDEGPFRFKTLLLPVSLPERVLIGTDLARLWMAPDEQSLALKGLAERELIVARPGVRPALHLDGRIVVFDVLRSGPTGDRLAPLEGAKRETVQHAVNEIAAELRTWRARVETVAASLGDGPAWSKCAICGDDPRLAFFPYTGEGEPPKQLRVRERYLEVLGAPLFDDLGSSREWCLKKCPLCATHYFWKSEYDYFVNGASESSELLERLQPDAVQPWLDRVAECVRRGSRW